MALQFKTEVKQLFLPTQPHIELIPHIFHTGPYIIKNMEQQQVHFNTSWSLKKGRTSAAH